MAYRDDIASIGGGPTHHWPLDGVTNELGNGIVPGSFSLNGAAAYNGAPITQDAANSLRATTGRLVVANTSDLNSGNNLYQTRSFSMWFLCESLENPTVIWEEGAGVNNFAAMAGVARNVSVQAADQGAYYLTRFADNLIEEGKAYHLVFTWERGTTTGGAGTRLRMWLNGVEQGTTYDITDPSTAPFPSHGGDIALGNSTEGLKFYNESTLPGVLLTKRVAHWACWNDYLLTQADIDLLFTSGALQTSQILTLSAMPADTSVGLFLLDALGGSPIQTFESVVRDSAGTNTYAYDVTTYIPARLRLVRYGFQTYEVDTTFSRFPQTLPFFFLADGNITEPDPAVVRAYATIDTADQLWDRARAYDEDNPGTGFDLFTAQGSTLNLGDFDLIVDAAAAAAFDVNIGTSTITIRSSAFTVSSGFDGMVTTGTVSSAGGATIDGVISDSSGTTGVLQTTGSTTYTNSAVYVERDDNSTFYFQLAQDSPTSISLPPGESGDWGYTIFRRGTNPGVGGFDPTGGGFRSADYTQIDRTAVDSLEPHFTGAAPNSTINVTFDLSTPGSYLCRITLGDEAHTVVDIANAIEIALETEDGCKFLLDRNGAVPSRSGGAGTAGLPALLLPEGYNLFTAPASLNCAVLGSVGHPTGAVVAGSGPITIRTEGLTAEDVLAVLEPRLKTLGDGISQSSTNTFWPNPLT